ncbi:hypothetical protein HELRODRAFT_195072 [Helobdella robusta]|uniref:Uncharacterized protein n=1 Tax=Helobdella robusta TaxID=6412 RepID=T1FWQ4_HELRO|nr:hypothetical protein HELRODRAFT_195072 [Helobdella robusta]ESO08285.1 hypothetical protein HELRODRAFT_195072 [Helobdella robusta]
MADNKPFLMACGFGVISFVLCLIGFGTGYWFVSADDTNLFESIGLWQVCFNGYEHTSDLVGKAYYGCWWIFYKEYYYIRNWLMPPWFKAVQTLMTLAVVLQFIFLPLLFIATADAKTKMLKILCTINAFIASLITTSVVIFGVMVGLDRTWVPRWDQDELGWSYGLAVLSGFFSWFSLICLCVYTTMRSYELENKEKKPFVQSAPSGKRTPQV